MQNKCSSPLCSVGKCPPNTFFCIFCYDNGYVKRWHYPIFKFQYAKSKCYCGFDWTWFPLISPYGQKSKSTKRANIHLIFYSTFAVMCRQIYWWRHSKTNDIFPVKTIEIFTWIIPVKLNYESMVDRRGLKSPYILKMNPQEISEAATRTVLWRKCSENIL